MSAKKCPADILEIFSGRRAGAEGSPVEKLTDREFEVFQLIGQGKGTRDIAEKLHLSVKTVEVHRTNIKKKLKLKLGVRVDSLRRSLVGIANRTRVTGLVSTGRLSQKKTVMPPWKTTRFRRPDVPGEILAKNGWSWASQVESKQAQRGYMFL